MIKSLKYLVGNPISTEQAYHERLDKKTALAVFSSDALSSIAYSTEAILLVLLAAGTIATGYLVPIVVGITVLLAILALSYRRRFTLIRRAAKLTSSLKTIWERRLDWLRAHPFWSIIF